MAELKKALESLGLLKVNSYLQSGNVVFKSISKDINNLEKIVEDQVEKRCNIQSKVMIFTLEEWQEYITNNPFPVLDLSSGYLTILANENQDLDEDKIKGKLIEGEKYLIRGRAIYLYCPKGYGNSKLNNNFFESICKTSATTRNWKTTLAIYDLAKKINLEP